MKASSDGDLTTVNAMIVAGVNVDFIDPVSGCYSMPAGGAGRGRNTAGFVILSRLHHIISGAWRVLI